MKLLLTKSACRLSNYTTINIIDDDDEMNNYTPSFEVPCCCWAKRSILDVHRFRTGRAVFKN